MERKRVKRKMSIKAHEMRMEGKTIKEIASIFRCSTSHASLLCEQGRLTLVVDSEMARGGVLPPPFWVPRIGDFG
jgi:hypothetical protein